MYQSSDHRKYLLQVGNSRTGNLLYCFNEQGKRYALVEEEDLGDPYFIRVSNMTSGRAEAVVSVDGLSVMNGKEASREDNGYVLYANEHYDIRGWRRGLNEVAAFTFTSAGQSYAGKTGRPDNIGVIGACFYPEKVLPKYRVEGRRLKSLDDTLRAYPASEGMLASNKVGTGYGDKVSDKVQTVQFTRGTTSPITFVLYYKTRQELEALGIRLPIKRTEVESLNPFPADSKYFTPEP